MAIPCVPTHLNPLMHCAAAEEQFVWRAIVLLEKAVSKSPSNFQFKLFLIQLYSTLGE